MKTLIYILLAILLLSCEKEMIAPEEPIKIEDTKHVIRIVIPTAILGDRRDGKGPAQIIKLNTSLFIDSYEVMVTTNNYFILKNDTSNWVTTESKSIKLYITLSDNYSYHTDKFNLYTDSATITINSMYND